MDELLDPLNPAQREAVLHGDGPMLVLAGAGSGKTRVIVHRIARLVRDLRVAPWQILAVTFTNKAAGEMRERLMSLLGVEAGQLWVSTFHAFGARFLRREAARAGLPADFAIYDDGDQMSLVKQLLGSSRFADQDGLTPREILSRIDRWKNQGLFPEQVSAAPGDLHGQASVEIYRRYQEALRRAGATDFGDLLVRPLKMLEQEPDLRKRWAGRFRQLLVDEFQDTNQTQYRLIQLLAGERRNVCVVGDDDQAIYRWRGADVENILGFDRAFSGARVVKLEQNYRSTGRILEAAHAVISRATQRREKKLWTESGPGDPLALLVARDEEEEAQQIAYAVADARGHGVAGQEIAVLYRTNAQSRPIEAAFRAARISYVVVRGTSFYERAEVKDAASYLRLALSPRSDLDLLRVVNRPARGIGDKTLDRLRAHAEAAGLPLFDALADLDAIGELKPAARRNLAAFRDLVAGLHERVPAMEAGPAVQEVLQKSELLAKLQADGSDEAADKVENLLELVAAARQFDEARAGDRPSQDPEEPQPSSLAGFLEQIALLGDADGETPEGRVALMTLHAAKGLEFEVVFMAGMEESMLPYSRPWRRQGAAPEQAADLDEERRLCYVGMTRAKHRLVLSLARRRMGFSESGPSFRDTQPSRFLGDLSPELFGLPAHQIRPAAVGPVVRRHAGSLPDEPFIELDDVVPDCDEPGEAQEDELAPAQGRAGRAGGVPTMEPIVDYSFDQRSDGGTAFTRGERVVHGGFGEGVVRTCDASGPQAKVTVAFFSVGEKRVLARFLRRP